MRRFVALDTETTGFSPLFHRIVEFGAVEVVPRSGALGSELRLLVNPGSDIPAQATAVHGIRNEDIRDKPLFRDVAREISEFISGATLVIQNADFDVPMLDAEFGRSGLPPVSETAATVVDLLDVTEHVHPFLPRRTLDAICGHYGISLADRTNHGALLDSKLMAATLPYFAADFDTWQSIVENQCAEDVATFSEKLMAFVDDSIANAKTGTAEESEGAARRLAAVSKGLSMFKKWFDAALDALLDAGENWNCKHYAAHWRPSGRTSWKDVAAAHLSSTDLAAFMKESIATTYTPEPDEAVLERANALMPLYQRGAIAKSVSSVLRALCEIKAAEKRIDYQREDVRGQVLSHVRDGYDLKHGKVNSSSRASTSYKDAYAELCPSVDLTSFKSESKSIAILHRDTSACEILFS